jgi:acyl-CoA synthetase (AMP-forming)/AMP-acid ligase II
MSDPATAFEAFANSTAAGPERSCICLTSRPGRAYYPEGTDWTYAQVMREVSALREIYRRAGYGVGHRVGLLLDSRPEIVFHWLALNALGASIVPLNPEYRAAEFEYVLGHAEVQVVVALPQRVSELLRACQALAPAPGVVLLQDFATALPPPRNAPATAGMPDLGTEAAILYTSGTTAAPKGCIITNDYCIAAGTRYIGAGGLMAIRPGEERLFNPLPLFYVNSLIITNMAMILSGGCMIYPDRFHPATWWRDVAQTRATIVQYLGIVLPALLNQAPCPEERAHSVRFGVGAGVDPTRHREFEERFGFPIFEVWGMTEVAIASIAHREPRHVDTRSIGEPLAGIEFRVVDEHDVDLPDNVQGELIVRAAGSDPRRGLFGGYYKDPEATAAAWRKGWFHTGDLVARRADATYCFVDRAKDIIRRSGQNISASEVEAALRAHPEVALAAAIPVCDELREEEVLACIVLRDPAQPGRETAQRLVQWSLERLAYFKVPGWIVFRDSLPVTYTQKIRKRDIFAAGEDPRVRADCHDLRGLKKPAAAGAGQHPVRA